MVISECHNHTRCDVLGNPNACGWTCRHLTRLAHLVNGWEENFAVRWNPVHERSTIVPQTSWTKFTGFRQGTDGHSRVIVVHLSLACWGEVCYCVCKSSASNVGFCMVFGTIQVVYKVWCSWNISLISEWEESIDLQPSDHLQTAYLSAAKAAMAPNTQSTCYHTAHRFRHNELIEWSTGNPSLFMQPCHWTIPQMAKHILLLLAYCKSSCVSPCKMHFVSWSKACSSPVDFWSGSETQLSFVCIFKMVKRIYLPIWFKVLLMVF